MLKKFSALLVGSLLLLPHQVFAAAPTWTTYNIGDGLQAESIDLRYSTYEEEYGLLYAKTGATSENADGYFRAYLSNSPDGTTFFSGNLIKDVVDSYPIEGSVVRLSAIGEGQYTFIKPSVSRGVNDSTEFGSPWDFGTPTGLSQSFTRGDLLPEQDGTIIFATGLLGSLPIDRKIVAYVSTDSGASFSQTDIATNLTSQPNEVFAFRLSGGGFAVVWNENGGEGSFMRISTSADGSSWSAPITNTHDALTGGYTSPISAAIDSSDNIYVAFAYVPLEGIETLDLNVRLAKFPANGSAWDTDEEITSYLATGFVPDLQYFSFLEVSLGIVNGTTPIIAYYEPGTAYQDPAAPGSVKYALREAGSGCAGANGANFTCGVIDSSFTETIAKFDSNIATPLDMEVHGSDVVVVYNDLENSKLKAAYTTVTLDSGGGGGGGGGGGIPEFSDYMYIATVLAGILLIKKYVPKQI